MLTLPLCDKPLLAFDDFGMRTAFIIKNTKDIYHRTKKMDVCLCSGECVCVRYTFSQPLGRIFHARKVLIETPDKSAFYGDKWTHRTISPQCKWTISASPDRIYSA